MKIKVYTTTYLGWPTEEVFDTQSATTQTPQETIDELMTMPGVRNARDVGLIATRLHKVEYERRRTMFAQSLTLEELGKLLTNTFYLVREQDRFELIHWREV